MQRATSHDGSLTRVEFSGVWTMDEFEPNKAMLAQLEAAAPKQVEFDMSQVTAIDSAGIGMLILANDRLTKAKIDFRLVGATGTVARILEVAKIREIITIV
ncbi:STAS domain-containing protein [Maricaulis sp.]|uniref:STAS domain-containing protein n=1 Tax=Maricaulis sp. TaxID=1486257 RepID=UPI0025C2A382|nr:STAS domain-containing protein [Maricaulis sp.]